MLWHYIFSLLLACVLWKPSESNTNLLGAGVNFPLLLWDGSQLVDTFGGKGVFGKICMKNGAESTLTVEAPVIISCKDKLDTGMNDVENEQLCGNLDEFFDCMDEVRKTYKEACDYNDDEKKHMHNIDVSNRAIMNEICKDDAVLYAEFKKAKGKECSRKYHKEILKCTSDNTEGDMRYDQDGCKKARSYVSCIHDVFEGCGTELANVIERVMTKALDTTPCKNHPASSASTTVAEIIFVFLCSYVLFFMR